LHCPTESACGPYLYIFNLYGEDSTIPLLLSSLPQHFDQPSLSETKSHTNMSYQVRDSYLPLILTDTDVLLHSNTDKDLLLVTAVLVVMAADSLTRRPLVPLPAPTPSTFYPYPPLSTIVGPRSQLID